MSIQFLRRKVGAKSTLGSLFGLALIFYLLGLIRSDYISEIFYLTILFTAVITLLVSVVLIGTLNILCGQTTFKRCLIYIGCGVGVVPLWILMPIPFGIFVPYCFFGFIYGVGGYIGFCIQRRRSHAA
jgi:hypothetical protein